MREKSNSFEFTIDVLLEILDYSSDEIFVLDKNEQIVYVNSMCERHYGLKPSDVIGKYNDELFTKGYWKPSIIPDVFEHKKPCYITQETYLGTKLLTSAIPILNDEKEIEYVVINAAQLQKYKTLYNDG